SFAGLVLACLEDPRPLVAAVMLAPHPFADRVRARPDVEVVPVAADNRDRLPAELAERLGELEWRARHDRCRYWGPLGEGATHSARSRRGRCRL
ncbi:MAG: hypothetical protein ACPLPT_10420, partial [Moorellales bacterium]